MILPFMCSKCHNWYTPVPVIDEDTGEPLVCLLCEEGRHAPTKAGVIDCHIGHMTATKSEVALAKAYNVTLMARETAKQCNHELDKATVRSQVDALLVLAQSSYTAAEKAVADIPEALRWAGVMEMPGLKSQPNDMRFKSSDVVELLVKENRRPPQDLRRLRRSEKVCRELANQCVQELPLARAALTEFQGAAAAWSAPTTPASSVPTSLPVAAQATAMAQRVECGCGGFYKHGSKNLHERTNTHKSWAAKQQLVTA